ncbi:pleckstrin homology domain-containing family B member 2-like [Ruditapes philippinarum]|uniref:pleckstrin homology domain-containing family B member 2-like n=1 Tax=Ruditapes philippinarum TaxID=129788 RepID=UPI00295AF177|nr:pleckstrin homology domain-containing family B member 2-like [Ruditapes philippinarum]
MEIQIVKAGWLQRRSTVLHRWKKNWFVLYRSGELAYFESQDKHEAEERFIVCAVCLGIKTTGECDFSAPEGSSKQCLFSLQLRNADNLKLCAESPDDMRAWHIALEEARTMNRTGDGAAPPGVVVPPGSQVIYPQTYSHGYRGGYPGQIIAAPGQYVVSNASGGGPIVMGNQPGGQVVCVREPYYYRRGYYSPLVMGPVLWW